MAFPTSGLVNNLVHKEGNRAFVYDSALGVWDQVREADSSENKILSGSIGSEVTFPAGHVVQTVQTLYRDIVSFTAETAGGMSNYGDSRAGYDVTVLDSTITPSATSSKILIMTNILVGLDSAAYSILRLKRGIGGSTPSFDGSASGWSAGDTPANWHNDRSSTPGAGTNAGAQCFHPNDTTGYDPCVLNWYYLDSPATTSAVVYRFNLGINSGASSRTGFINMTAYNANDFGATSGISTVILQEVSG